MIDVCCAPMPFVVGVHATCVPVLRTMPLEDVVVVDLDRNRVATGPTALDATSLITAVVDYGGVAGLNGAPNAPADDKMATNLPARIADILRVQLETAGKKTRYTQQRFKLFNKTFFYFISSFFLFCSVSKCVRAKRTKTRSQRRFDCSSRRCWPVDTRCCCRRTYD